MYMSHVHRVTAGSDIEGCGAGVVRDRVGIQGGYTGWVYRVLPSQHALLGESASPSEAGPGSPSGAGVGGD